MPLIYHAGASAVTTDVSVMRTSPCWTCSSWLHHQATSRRQLGLRVRFGISQKPCTQTVMSPSYVFQIRCSQMHWKLDDETLPLVRVPAPEDSWIILCVHDKVLRHLFWAEQAFVSCRALSPSCGRPLVSPNPRTSLFLV